MPFEEFRGDVRLAWRGLRRAKGFTAAAVLTLALGIAGTTVMFTLVEGVLLRPPPVPDHDRLIVAWRESRSAGMAHFPLGARAIEGIRRESRLLERVAGVGYNGAGAAVAVESGRASYISVGDVTGDFFAVVGVAPVLGRALNHADDVPGAENVLVITHALWQRRYGHSRDVIGRRLTIAGRPFTIVGVMPADFEYPRGVEAWQTIAALASTVNPAFREGAQRDIDLIARLRPGVTNAQAAGELQQLSARFDADAPPDGPRGLTPVVRSYYDETVGEARTPMLMLFGAVGLVLLIASANVTNLILVRTEGRRPELAMRAALGASRSRLARQLFVECALVALAAGAVGLAASWWGLDALIALVPDGLPRAHSVRIDAAVLLFTLAIALLTAALAGVAPALSSSRVDLSSELRRGGHAGVVRALQSRQRALVVSQIALAVTLVAGAGLLTRSLLRLQRVDMGLAADRLVFLELDVPQAKYTDRARHLQFLKSAIANLEAVPGIARATPVNTPPFAGTGGWDVPLFTAEGQTGDQAKANPSLNLESVHPNYFDTFQITLARGRAFTEDDREGAPEVAIVSRDVATRMWPGENPIGKRIKFGGPSSAEPWRTVVGVAAPTRYRELGRTRPTVYVPAIQFIAAARLLVLRTTLPATAVANAARARLIAIDPGVQVMRVVPFAALAAAPLARPRFNALLIDMFAVTALLLVAIGVYAVVAASVRQRYREIGVRVALGATSADVRRLVLGEGLRLGAIGTAAGLAMTASGARMLRGLLYEVDALDPPSIVGAASLVVLMTVIACSIPAWRATRVSPVETLRTN